MELGSPRTGNKFSIKIRFCWSKKKTLFIIKDDIQTYQIVVKMILRRNWQLLGEKMFNSKSVILCSISCPEGISWRWPRKKINAKYAIFGENFGPKIVFIPKKNLTSRKIRSYSTTYVSQKRWSGTGKWLFWTCQNCKKDDIQISTEGFRK